MAQAICANHDGFLPHRRSWAQKRFLNLRSLESANSVRGQLQTHLEKLGMACLPQRPAEANPEFYRRIQKALCAGMFMQTAFCGAKGQYMTAKDMQPVTWGRLLGAGDSPSVDESLDASTVGDLPGFPPDREEVRPHSVSGGSAVALPGGSALLQ
eukprot:scaffold7461_cov296-Pinguiococcus_pyrenoidosus.AAC.1